MSAVLPAISALGTVWYVELFDEVTEIKAHETYSLVRLLLSDFETRYSRFKPDSCISILNHSGHLDHPDATTLELLHLGQKFYQDTDGIFNILIGEHLLARGYDAKYSFKPSPEPKDFPSPLTALTISQNKITLTEGQVDLGGYGKGFLIDRLRTLLQEQGHHYFLINGGGDMYATSDQGSPVTIYLEHPTEPGLAIKKTTLKEQGFAASSTHKRRWKVSGLEYSHIVDTAKTATRAVENDPSPQSKSVQHITPDTFAIYVKAPTAVLADVWATTLLITEPKIYQSRLELGNIALARYYISNNTLTSSPNF